MKVVNTGTDPAPGMVYHHCHQCTGKIIKLGFILVPIRAVNTGQFGRKSKEQVVVVVVVV